GTIMSYDFTQTVASGGALVQCQGRTWTATAGSSANEVVFTPDTPIVLPPEQSASPTLNNCFISFQVKLESLEPTSGANSDDTPQKVEVVAGFSTVIANGHADAECDNGGASGVSQSSGIFICPSCTVDQCNLGCDTTTGTCQAADASTPCADTDGNTCTTAGCELSADLGVCVQTHMFASNSTPCADTDNNACTTAGCNGQGACDQTHLQIQSTSNCANPIVGTATDCTVLELDGSKVDITGPPGGIVGDICIGPNGHLSITGSEFVTGEVRLAAGATFSKSGSGTVGSVENGQDLSAEINAAMAASASAASQACTLNLTSIKSSTTINATGGGTAATGVGVQD